MRPAETLDAVQLQAVRRLYRLKALSQYIRSPISSEEDRLLSFVAIELLNVWSAFSKSFYLSCAFGARTAKGGRVVFSVPKISDKREAMLFAINQFKKTPLVGAWTWSQEPVWRKPNTLLRILTNAGSSNVRQVQAAFGYQTLVFDCLPTIRNFYAHRSEGTALELRQVAQRLAFRPSTRAGDLLAGRGTARPQSLVCDWIDDLRLAVETMCE